MLWKAVTNEEGWYALEFGHPSIAHGLVSPPGRLAQVPFSLGQQLKLWLASFDTFSSLFHKPSLRSDSAVKYSLHADFKHDDDVTT